MYSLLQYNKVIGPIQLRQVRVKNDSCKISKYAIKQKINFVLAFII